MFNFFKKKKDDTPTQLVAVCQGQLVDLASVSDPIFAQKMMGDGFAVQPENGAIYSPVTGTVKNIFPTKHAIGLESDKGLEILIHLGFDTVELEGAPFDLTVSEGQQVQAGDTLGQADLEAITQAGKDTTFVVIFTNMDQVESLDLESPQAVTPGQAVGTVQAK
ncbi:PTS sugar transporter subunit IIA [Hutsoniella sourekii]|uniref:PTS sugar transporter subunit IIA n=1 Tax=Hutsoniella sourekii TaxID=87650 RepID=UPI000482FF09|nr:PTS glucose transporter subunit IIA [Hutsoniella sourekii]